jgi:two-component system cell cycle response regulator
MVNKNSTKILIIEDHHEMVMVLTKFLSEHGFQISSSESGEDALKKIQNDKPDIILMDIMLPGISGIELTQKIRSNGFIDSYIPILMLTAKNEVKDVVQGLEVGADDYIIKPFHFDELVARINTAIRLKNLNEKFRSQSKELEFANQRINQLNQTLIEKNKDLRKKIYDLHNIFDVSFELHSILDTPRLINSTLLFIIGQFGCKSTVFFYTSKKTEQRLTVLNSKGFYQSEIENITIERSDPLLNYVRENQDPLLFDKIPENLTHSAAYNVLKRLQINLLSYVLVHKKEEALICLGPRVKKDAYAVNELEILSTINNIVSVALSNASLYDEVIQLSYTDGMTELHNYRYFEMRLKEEVIRHTRNQQDVSLIILDVDHFKNYNDTLGHQAGDEVLKKIASLLKETVRENDIVARYGGEEFAIIAPSNGKEEIKILAERVRQNVEKYIFPNENIQPSGKITISVGTATLPLDAKDSIDLIRKADTALYAAKNLGRNMVIQYSPELT